MSLPFGEHPTFAQYLSWAISQGCTVRSGYATTEDGRAEGATLIASADGTRWVVEVGTGQRERLHPTAVARLDRRLGMKSPFFSIDDSGYVPTVS